MKSKEYEERLRRSKKIVPAGGGPFPIRLRYSSVEGLDLFLRRASPDGKMTCRATRHGFSTGSLEGDTASGMR
jgi:hypothetical protein